MGSLISRSNVKWNNYVKRTKSDKTQQETTEYILHLQQQIDALKLEVERAKGWENVINTMEASNDRNIQ